MHSAKYRYEPHCLSDHTAWTDSKTHLLPTEQSWMFAVTKDWVLPRTYATSDCRKPLALLLLWTSETGLSSFDI